MFNDDSYEDYSYFVDDQVDYNDLDVSTNIVMTFNEFTNINEECNHEDSYFDYNSDIAICNSCGVQRSLPNFNQDRYSANKQSFKGSKFCYEQNKGFKSLTSTFRNNKIPICKNDIFEIELLFNNITKKKILVNKEESKDKDDKAVVLSSRASCRKGVIGGCLFYKMPEKNIYYTTDEICKMMQISKKKLSEGQNLVLSNFENYKFFQIGPENLFETVLKKHLKLPEYHFDAIKFLYEKLKKVLRPKINKCNPQSISSGLIYCYLFNMHKRKMIDELISLVDFAKIINLSEATIRANFKMMNSMIKNIC